MPYTSEIDKLERRYAENPKGRNFAPLADAYRKAGQLDQAIELCKSGLARHPDYVSAHIVYGRCMMDQKDDGAAEQVFRKVLELDPENVIAFRVLAEIAERGSRFADAVVWLTRLLAADPMNGDAAEALAVAKGKAGAGAGASAGASAAPTAAAADTAQPDFVVEHLGPPEPTAPSVSTAIPGLATDLETFDGTLDFNSVAHGAAKAEGLEVQEEVVLKPSEVVVEGLARTQYEGSGVFKIDVEAAAAASPAPSAPLRPSVGAPAPPAPPAPPRPPRPPVPPPPPAPLARAPAANQAPLAEPDPADDLPSVDLPLFMPDDIDPPAATPRSARTTPAPPPPPRPPAPPPAPPERPGRRAVPGPTPAAVMLSDDDGAADTAALSRAEPVLTETMAELYLKQGHEEEALRVYRALLDQRPTDARLRTRVQGLTGGGQGPESSGSGLTVQTFLRGILASRPGAQAEPAAAPSPLESAFAEPPLGGEPSHPGEPTHAATDTISLDQVFGDESPAPSQATTAGSPAPPPSPPSPPPPVSPPPTSSSRAGEAAPPAPPAPPATGGFSFDEFFGSGGPTRPGTPGVPPAPADADAGKGPPTGGRARLAAEDEGDLDQFQAWLKGLKG